jgi:hypothetical protein
MRIGPLGALNEEFAKKRRHLPLRKLMEKAGVVIQTLKSVFMMSPLSVAQFGHCVLDKTRTKVVRLKPSHLAGLRSA